MQFSDTNVQMKATFLSKYCYAINWTIFFMCEWFWFGIPESYVIKQFMRLTNMHVAELSL